MTFLRKLADLLTAPGTRGFLFLALVVVGVTTLAPTAHAGLWEDIAGGAINVVASFFATIVLLITNLIAVVLGWVGLLFNWIMLVSVFQFANYFGNSSGLLLAWSILRDIANIALLFGFVFMGIAMILDLHQYHAKKAVPLLIIFAVLLNFSLFATEAMIDGANAVSSVFYSQAAGGVDCRNNTFTPACAEDGIAGKMLTATGIASVWAFDGSNEISIEQLWGGDGVKKLVMVFGLFMLIVVTLAIMVAGSILLLSRAIVLVIVMATSPIGFAGMAIPQLHDLSAKWWKALINNLLFAPVFVLLILVGFKIVEGLRTSLVPEGESIAVILQREDVSTGSLLVLFGLAIGFMYASLKVAKDFGIMGAEKVVGSAENFIRGTAGFALAGVPAFAARNTVGRGSDMAARAIRLSPLGNIPILGNRLAAMADAGAKASFDSRGKGGLLGKPSELAQKGFRGGQEATKKRLEEYNKSLGEEDKEKYTKLKSEKDRIREKIDDALGTHDMTQAELEADPTAQARFGPQLAKMKELDGKMGETTEGKRSKEGEKKEKMDESVKEWNETSRRLETIADKLSRIDQDLKTASGPRVAELNAEKAKYEAERNDLVPHQADLEDKVVDLRSEIKKLRLAIRKEDSAFRRNVHDMATPSLLGLSVVDRAAMKKAVVAMRKGETTWKPKNLDDTLGRALQKHLKDTGRI